MNANKARKMTNKSYKMNFIKRLELYTRINWYTKYNAEKGLYSSRIDINIPDIDVAISYIKKNGFEIDKVETSSYNYYVYYNWNVKSVVSDNVSPNL